MIQHPAKQIAVPEPDYSIFKFSDDGIFPNNDKLPLIFYRQPFGTRGSSLAATIEKLFIDNGWVNSWRNGLYTIHHYHSSAHEVLGLYSGWVTAQLGGPTGEKIKAQAGDVLIIPAGVCHKNIQQSADFRVIGAYPEGQQWDMNYGKAGERPKADRQIKNVPLPLSDPVFGAKGPLRDLWR